LPSVDPSIIALAIFHNAGLVALVALTYGSVLRRTVPGATRHGLLSLLFGIGVYLAMSSPITLSDGIVIDGRAVVIALSAVFAGWPAALVTTSIAALHRLETGGIGALSGITGIVWVCLSSMFVVSWRRRPFRVDAMRDIAVVAMVASMMPLAMFIMPFETALPIFLAGGLPLVMANFAGVMIFGRVLGREYLRHQDGLQAHRDARTDALTGLQNRRGFDTDAVHAVQVARAKGHPLALVMIDVDHFKKINDIWGHAAGDMVLRRIGEIISSQVRSRDIVSRFGGEEVAVLMPHATLDAALAGAERIRREIEATVFDLGGIPVKVTVSAGTAVLQDDMSQFAELFSAADRALYRAKEAGRNRVEAAQARQAA
jgi:diguanylate cyclase